MPFNTAYKPTKPSTYSTDPNLDTLMQMQLQPPPETGQPGTPGYGPQQIDPTTGLINGAFEGAPYGIPYTQIDTSQIPQPGMPPEIQAMIGGQGYDPQTLAMMRAGAIEDVSNAALPQLGAMRRGLSSAGLLNSPAGAAYQADIGRLTGQAQSGALRDISINNAQTGNQNRVTGLNWAHSYAMENANRLFEGMGQNAGLAQQRNLQQASQIHSGQQNAINQMFGQNPYTPPPGQGLESAAGTGFSSAGQAIGNIPQQPAKLPNTIGG